MKDTVSKWKAWAETTVGYWPDGREGKIAKPMLEIIAEVERLRDWQRRAVGVLGTVDTHPCEAEAEGLLDEAQATPAEVRE